MKNKGCVARWGGEEFLFVFYNANIGKSLQYLTEICTTIQNYNFHYESFNFHTSMTFGLQYYSKNLGLEGTLKIADKKLYYGKQHGRNQVVAYDID